MVIFLSVDIHLFIKTVVSPCSCCSQCITQQNLITPSPPLLNIWYTYPKIQLRNLYRLPIGRLNLDPCAHPQGAVSCACACACQCQWGALGIFSSASPHGGCAMFVHSPTGGCAMFPRSPIGAYLLPALTCRGGGAYCMFVFAHGGLCLVSAFPHRGAAHIQRASTRRLNCDQVLAHEGRFLVPVLIHVGDALSLCSLTFRSTL